MSLMTLPQGISLGPAFGETGFTKHAVDKRSQTGLIPRLFLDSWEIQQAMLARGQYPNLMHPFSWAYITVRDREDGKVYKFRTTVGNLLTDDPLQKVELQFVGEVSDLEA